MLYYKEFAGSIEWSQDDNCYYGKILGISDLVNYESPDLIGLKTVFEEAVEDYLEILTNLQAP